MAVLFDAQIDAQTLDSSGQKLAQIGTLSPFGFDAETPENENLSHDLALADVSGQDAQNGSSGRIRTYDQAINSRPLYH